MTLDPAVIGVAVVLLVAFVLIGSRLFPERVNFSPWRYGGSRDRPSAGVRENDDERFEWGPTEREDDDEP